MLPPSNTEEVPHLGLESLMLLDLGLQIGGILVALVRRGLELFVDPGLEFVSVAPEVLKAARLFQLLPLDLGGLLELDIAAENLKRTVTMKWKIRIGVYGCSILYLCQLVVLKLEQKCWISLCSQ